MNKALLCRLGLFLMLVVLVQTGFFWMGMAATPPHGSKMAHFLAPYYFDYVYIQDTFSITQVKADIGQNVTVQGHVYVQDVSCTGVEESFDVFQFWNIKYSVPYFWYGATVKVSNPAFNDELRLYVSTPYTYSLYVPHQTYIRTLDKEEWYNVTLVHYVDDFEGYVDVYVNEVLNATIENVPWSVNLEITRLRMGEISSEYRDKVLAYNIYCDYIRLEGGGLGSPLEWDFETNLYAFDVQEVSSNGVIELVTETEDVELGAAPSVSFDIVPSIQGGYVYERLEYDMYCYNEGSEAQFNLLLYTRLGDDGNTWTWTIAEPVFILGSGESKTVKLYCIVGDVGNWSQVTIHFRKVGTGVYLNGSAYAYSQGEDPSTVTPIGPIPSITGFEYGLFGLYGSLGLGGLFFGAMSRGREPIVGIIGFAFGIVFFTWIEWLPQWVMITMFALFGLGFAIKFIGGLGGK